VIQTLHLILIVSLEAHSFKARVLEHALEGMTSQIGLGPMNLQTKFSGAMSPYMKCKPFSVCLVLLMKEVGHLVCKGQLIVYFVDMKRAL
jgi:hypothetical protein